MVQGSIGVHVNSTIALLVVLSWRGKGRLRLLLSGEVEMTMRESKRTRSACLYYTVRRVERATCLSLIYFVVFLSFSFSLGLGGESCPRISLVTVCIDTKGGIPPPDDDAFF